MLVAFALFVALFPTTFGGVVGTANHSQAQAKISLRPQPMPYWHP
jgi:hypothetical protein